MSVRDPGVGAVPADGAARARGSVSADGVAPGGGGLPTGRGVTDDGGASRPVADRPVRMRDVAIRAGVSTKTVSEVVNVVGQVSAPTRARVLAAIAELDYRPNPSARRLSLGRTGEIALALPHLGSGDLAALAAAVIVAAEAAGIGVLVEPTGGVGEREADVLRSEAGVSDGVLLVPSSASLPTVSGTPVVVLGDAPVRAAVDQVVAARSAMIEVARSHLVANGRARVLVLGGDADADIVPDTSDTDGTSDADRAFAATQRAVAATWDASAGARSARTARSGSGSGSGSGDGAAAPFDGLIALDDGLALGALHALRTAGLRVPEDVAVVAIGNSPESAFSSPSITAVEPDVEEMARVAVSWLEERIAGSDVAARRYDVRTRLVERESSAGVGAGRDA